MSNKHGTFKKGHLVPDSWRQKISKAHKGRKASEEAKHNMSLARKGKKLSNKHKENISKGMMGRPSPMKGKHLSEEVRKKISLSNTGKKHNRSDMKRGSPYKELNDKGWLEKMYIENGLSSTQISDSIGCSARVVLDALRYFDIKVRSLSEAKRGERNPHSNGISEAHKQKIREYRKGKWSGNMNPWYGKTGEEHINWKGGVSFAPYCHKFNNKLKESIRDRDNRTCQLCGMKEDGIRLDVHHIHYDKPNCEPDLISLCRSCHTKVNFDRGYYEDLFIENLHRRGFND